MSGSAIPPLNIAITATDKTGAILDKVRQRVTQTGMAAEKAGKGIARLGETSSITRLSEGMKSLAGTSGEVFRSVSQLSPALSGITSAATLSGMTALVARWGQLGQQAYLTGQRLGIPTDRLTALRGAARLAGASAEDLNGGLTSLDERLRGATFRGDATAIQTFGLLGVSFRKDATHARDASEALGDVADGIKKLYDGGKGRGAALRAAQNLGLESLFPLLIKGRSGIQALSAEAARLGGTISPEAAKRASELKSSFEGLELAVGGVANRLGDQWGQAVKPYIDGTANWIANNKELADSYGNIGTSILALGAIRPAAWLARLLGINVVGRAGLSLARGVGAEVLPALAVRGGVAAGAATAGGGVLATIGALFGYDIYRHVAPTALGGRGPDAPVATVPRTGTAAFDVMKQTHDFWRSKGLTEKQTAGILANIAAESSFNPGLAGDRGTSYGLYQEHAARRDALIARYGANPTVDQQNQFAYDELQEASRRGTWTAIQHAQTSGASAVAFGHGFENPKNALTVVPARARDAPSFEGAFGTAPAAAAVPGANGAVDVHVTIAGAPPGTTVKAAGSGAVNVAPPRVETAMPLH